MSYRSHMALGAAVLLVVAATTIDAPPVVWQPSWPIRLGIGGAGVLLALGALLTARAAGGTGGPEPAAGPRGAPHTGRDIG